MLSNDPPICLLKKLLRYKSILIFGPVKQQQLLQYQINRLKPSPLPLLLGTLTNLILLTDLLLYSTKPPPPSSTRLSLAFLVRGERFTRLSGLDSSAPRQS